VACTVRGPKATSFPWRNGLQSHFPESSGAVRARHYGGEVPRSTVAMTEEQVQSAKAHGYSSVMLGLDVLMLKNAASTAIGWAKSSA